MGRIKILDLSEDKKISNEEMRKVLGGIIINDMSPLWTKPILKIRPSINLKGGGIGPISIYTSL